MEELNLKEQIDRLDPELHQALRARLIARYQQMTGLKSQVERYAIYQKNSIKEPYFNQQGDLIIPFDSDNRYHWWNGGQSIAETLKEIEEKLKSN